MATVVYAEGYEHRALSLNDFSAADGEGIADTITNTAQISIVTTAPRNGAAHLRVDANALATSYEKFMPGTNPAVVTMGIGIRFPTALPSADTRLFKFTVTTGTTGRLWFNTPSNKFNISISGSIGTDIGPVVVADQWYWIDIRYDRSGGTATLDAAVDGGTNTQVTLVEAATTITLVQIGADAAQTADVYYDDMVISYTGTDYPLGKKKVLPLHVNGDGSHNTGGAGNFDKQDGTDITDATTDAWLLIDDWITQPTDGASTGILNLLNAGSTLYTEHTFDDTTEATIDAVMGTVASAVSSATAHTATYRIVDSGGATIKDLFSGDVSISIATHYRHVLVSQNPTSTTVNGYKFRFGFSTDAAPDPQVTAVMLAIVVPEAAAAVLPPPPTIVNTAVDRSYSW